MNKNTSRKYLLTIYVILIATAMTLLPPIISVFFLPAPMIIMTGTEFASIVSMALLFYNGSNVLQKKFEGDSQEITTQNASPQNPSNEQ